ncbi:MAG: hypothetical protein WC968_01255 [Bacilli bacterium]|jgi:hypothetical protein
MIPLNHKEIEREISQTLVDISAAEDFMFQMPLEINAKTNGITFGIPVVINLFKDAFYFQIAFGDYRKSHYLQISFRLLIGEIKHDKDILPIINKLNLKLLYGKAVLNEEGEKPYLTIEQDFNAANVDQVKESMYDFLNDLIDDDVTPQIEMLLTKMRSLK